MPASEARPKEYIFRQCTYILYIYSVSTVVNRCGNNADIIISNLLDEMKI